MSLVITDIDFTVETPGTGTTDAGNPAGFSLRDRWIFSNANAVQQLRYSSGIVIPAGYQVAIFSSRASVTDTRILLHGYLTAR